MISGCVIENLKASCPEEAIKIMMAGLGFNESSPAVAAVLEREKKMNTYVGHSVSLPHAKTNQVKNIVFAFARSLDGIAWGDGIAHLIVLTLSGVEKSGPHVIFLSEIARFLSDEEIRERLMDARCEEEIREVLRSL